jgi:predicted dienelactone hydrolase
MAGMKRMAALMAVMLVAAGAAGAKTVKTVTPDGPNAVGVMLMHAQLGDRTAPVLVWYPAERAGGAPYKYEEAMEGTAVLDAKPSRSGAPYPLILFSHGLGGCGCQSVFYTENLASYGYVVVAPDHKDSAMCHIEGPPDITFGQIAWGAIKSGGDLSKTVFALFGDKLKGENYDFSYRPAEAKATIDAALAWNKDAASPLHGLKDPDKIGATGHSLGGYTTLMIGGVPFQCSGVQLKPEDCDTTHIGLTHAINPCCMDYVRDADPLFARDPRVKAMLPLGPAVFFPDLASAAKAIKIPMMIIAGDNKKMEVPWAPIQTLYDNAPSPKYAVRLKDTDHMTVADQTMAASPLVKLVLPGFRSHYQEKAQAYKDCSAAFFNLYLKGDHGLDGVLKAPENKYVELWAQP